VNVISTIAADTRFDIRPAGAGVAVDVRAGDARLTLIFPNVEACDRLATVVATCAHLLNTSPGEGAWRYEYLGGGCGLRYPT